MLPRPHNFHQLFPQVADATFLATSLWIAHTLRFYVLNGRFGLDGGYPLTPQFVNCYWMITLVLPVGPLALEYMGVYETKPPGNWFQPVSQIVRAHFLVLVAIFACIVVFYIPQETVSRAALVIFFVMSTVLVFLRYRLWLYLTRRYQLS